MAVRSTTELQKQSHTISDGALATVELTSLANALSWVPLYLLKRSDLDPSASPFDSCWHYPLLSVARREQDDAEPQLADLAYELAPVTGVWNIVRSLVRVPVRLYECEYTANPFGTEGHAHHDALRPEIRPDHITAIVYVNTEWQLDWGGETVIVEDEASQSLQAVLPRPGRICLLYGDPLHVARGVSRSCPQARKVLVFKMWRTSQAAVAQSEPTLADSLHVPAL